MLTVRISAIGTSAGIVLPEEALARLQVKEGDMILLTDAPGGGYRLTPCSSDFERQMDLPEEIMDRDREILKALK